MWNVTDWKRLCLVMNPGLFWGQMIIVYGCGGALVSCTIHSHTVLRHTAHTAGVMVWWAIAYDSRSTLIVMRGILTGQRYVDDILRLHVGPLLNGLLRQFSSKIMSFACSKSCSRLPTSFSDSSMAGLLPPFVPCRSRVVSAKTADASVSLCT
ncbi:DDE_3 domain-containing protein [Trichonephila clavipes]|nr:DDE_3 domain-containing protein [Trichonephila clavipes]